MNRAITASVDGSSERITSASLEVGLQDAQLRHGATDSRDALGRFLIFAIGAGDPLARVSTEQILSPRS